MPYRRLDSSRLSGDFRGPWQGSPRPNPSRQQQIEDWARQAVEAAKAQRRAYEARLLAGFPNEESTLQNTGDRTPRTARRPVRAPVADSNIWAGEQRSPDQGQWTNAIGPSGGFDPRFVDRNNARPEDGEMYLPVGNPANPGLRKQWEIREGRNWPVDPVTGRKYDVAHIKALADGGTNTLDNIRPMHPEAHRAEHRANGDASCFGKRPSIARTFGGRVLRGLGPLSIIPNITGILSGRIRTDNFDNFISDMMGMRSQDDFRREQEEYRKRFAPNAKPETLFT